MPRYARSDYLIATDGSRDVRILSIGVRASTSALSARFEVQVLTYDTVTVTGAYGEPLDPADGASTCGATATTGTLLTTQSYRAWALSVVGNTAYFAVPVPIILRAPSVVWFWDFKTPDNQRTQWEWEE